MVFDKGVHHSPRSWHLNELLSFYISTSLTSLALAVAGSRLWFWLQFLATLCWDSVDLGKSWMAWAGVPDACGRPTLEQGCGDLPAAESFPCSPPGVSA